MGKTILMACTHHLESAVQVGSQHLARCFARRGYRVIYLSAPITWLHLAKIGDADVRFRFRKAISRLSVKGSSITEIIPFAPIAPAGFPFLNSRLVVDSWQKYSFPSIRSHLRGLGGLSVDILYLDNICYKQIVGSVCANRFLFRVMDRHDKFPGWESQALPIVKELAREADCVFYSAEGLKRYVQSFKPRKINFLPNGVDWQRFDKLPSSHPALSEKIPHILTVGVFDQRIDFSILKAMAIEFSHCKFILAGPLGENVILPSFPSNVTYLGPVPYSDLPSLFSGARVVLIPFNIKEKLERLSGVRPLRLLEAMAAGKAVVCSNWMEVNNLRSPALLYEDKKECAKQLSRALIDHDLGDQGRRFARLNGWNKLCDCLIQFAEGGVL